MEILNYVVTKKNTHTETKKKKNSSHALPTTLHLEDRKILSHHTKLAPRI